MPDHSRISISILLIPIPVQHLPVFLFSEIFSRLIKSSLADLLRHKFVRNKIPFEIMSILLFFTVIQLLHELGRSITDGKWYRKRYAALHFWKRILNCHVSRITFRGHSLLRSCYLPMKHWNRRSHAKGIPSGQTSPKLFFLNNQWAKFVTSERPTANS